MRSIAMYALILMIVGTASVSGAEPRANDDNALFAGLAGATLGQHKTVLIGRNDGRVVEGRSKRGFMLPSIEEDVMSEFPETKVIALSIHGGKRFVENMLSAGAAGYMLKDSVPEELLDAIRTVLSGKKYLSAAVTGLVISQYVEMLSRVQAGGGASKLTQQERDFLLLIGEGWPGEEIAARFELDDTAVESVQESVLKKLGLSDVAELIEYAGWAAW